VACSAGDGNIAAVLGGLTGGRTMPLGRGTSTGGGSSRGGGIQEQIKKAPTGGSFSDPDHKRATVTSDPKHRASRAVRETRHAERAVNTSDPAAKSEPRYISCARDHGRGDCHGRPPPAASFPAPNSPTAFWSGRGLPLEIKTRRPRCCRSGAEGDFLSVRS
jgi:hypothetical protein